MEKFIMLGKFPYDFVDEKTGSRVQGVTCFLAPVVSSRGEGYYPKKFSYKVENVSWVPDIMEECYVFFNAYGKIINFQAC